jgi:hypothetical protein
MSKKSIIPSVILGMLLIGFTVSLPAQEAKKPRHAPDTLPGVEPEMLSADYWISLQPDADKIIMTPAEIGQFNAKIRSKESKGEGFEGPLRNPILPLELPATMPGDSLRVRLEKNKEQLYNPGDLYGSRDYYDGRLALWYEPMKDELSANMNITAIPPKISRRFGLVVNHTGVRQYPTSVPGYHNTTTMLDRFQITDLNIGYPVAVLHESADGAFLFAETPLALGWIPAADVAIADKASIRKFTESRNFLMGCADKVSVFGDPGFRNFARHLYMSETMPLLKKEAKGYVVQMGYRKPDGSLGVANGYLKPDADVHQGWMPYTKRTTLTQMFKMLNTPYGWHGQDNKRDCVGTLRIMFRCAGIETGRNITMASENRIPIDSKLSVADKIAKVAEIEPAITVVSNPGHTALLLGKARNGKLYFMHQGGWGYDEGDQHFYVNRVSLNEVEHKWFHINQPTLYTVMK